MFSIEGGPPDFPGQRPIPCVNRVFVQAPSVEPWASGANGGSGVRVLLFVCWLMAASALRAADCNRNGVADDLEADFPSLALHLVVSYSLAPGIQHLNTADIDDLSDAIYALAFLFLGGPPPPAPG